MWAFGRGAEAHVPPDHGTDLHDRGYTANTVNVASMIAQLNTCRDKPRQIAELIDHHLGSTSTSGSNERSLTKQRCRFPVVSQLL